MPKVLRADCKLDRKENKVFLCKRDDNSGPAFELHPLTAASLALFNGHRSDDEIIRILSEVYNLGDSKAVSFYNSLLARFRQFLPERDQFDSELNPNEDIDPYSYIFQTEKRVKPDRLPAPASMKWYVTRYCNRHCVYCYADAPHGNKALDSTLSTAEMQRIIDEASEIGVSYFSATGGEPFLRPDMVSIINYAIGRNMTFNVSTKHYLDEETVKQLNRERLEIDLSFDSHLESTADYLTGSRGFWQEMTLTMSLLHKYGISFGISAVVNSMNVRHLEPLIYFVRNNGAKYIRFQKYAKTQKANISNLQLSHETYRSIYEEFTELKKRISSPEFNIYWRKVEGVVDDDPRERAFNGLFDSKQVIQKEDFIRNSGCKMGRTEIAFRYDGKTCWCEQAPDDEFLVYGDLKQQSIMEVWESPKLLSIINPNKELYAGTECFNCESFDICKAKTSCIISSIRLSGSYFTPLPEIIDQCSRFRS